MKAGIVIAAALAASVNGAVIEARQRTRTSTRPGIPDVERCGLDAFEGHTSEAVLFCSSILKGGTATLTTTYTSRDTTTTRITTYTTIYPPSPSSTARPPSSTSRPPSSTSRPPSSTSRPPSSSSPPPSSTRSSSSPSPTATPASCGLVGYTANTAAYYFDSSGTKNNWAACSATCKADAKCQSFGYGEANCMLFDIPAGGNVNNNPMSPYTFYDRSCPAELPVLKERKLEERQLTISLGLPGGLPAISSACSCLITSAPGATTVTTTFTATSVRVTKTETVTRTLSLVPEPPRKY